MTQSNIKRKILFYRLIAVFFFLFVFLVAKLHNYNSVLLSPSGLFNHTLGSFLLISFVLGLLATLIAVAVFFYFILHETDG